MKGFVFHLNNFTRKLRNVVLPLSLLLVIVTVADVFLRYVFRSGSIALQEIEWHIFSLIFLLGAAYTLNCDEHVRVDIFYNRFNAKNKALINALGCIFFLIPFSALIIYTSIPFVVNSYQVMEGSAEPGGLPYRYLIKAALPVGFLLLMIEGINLLTKSIQSLFAKN
jgi:TRAP-type mannitol/chloroaromatic compound transport system permease small subunit